MNIKSPAIVLHQTRVSDKTSILHLYTRESGRVSYYIYGGKRRAEALLPLTLLDIDAVHLETREVQQLRDAQVRYVATATATDICRRTEALFIAEVLYRTLQHPLADPVLFDFLESVVEELNSRTDPENVHLEFLVGFISHLGFGIDFESPLGKSLLPLTEEQHVTNGQRRQLLRSLMDYYQLHLPDFSVPKSLDIMTEVFA